MRGIALLGAVLATASMSAGQLAWEKREPPTAPSVRAGHALAYDSRAATAVLFGGASGSRLFQETWTWDGVSWSRVMTAHAPPSVVGFGLVHDPVRDRLVLHGGQGCGPTACDDTWEFDGVDWVRMSPLHSPPLRGGPSLIFHSRMRRTFLFGGWLRSDTWVWGGSDWTELRPNNAPSAREGHAMAYDQARDRVVLFGGRDITATPLDDHWEFDGTDWVQIRTSTVPTPRAFSHMVYDPHRQRVVMFHGLLPTGSATEWDSVWEYDGVDWTRRIVPAPVPTVATSAAVAYDEVRRRVVAFGLVASRTVETWELYATNPATYDRFAFGCQPTRASLGHGAWSWPWIGDAFEVAVEGPAASTQAFLLTGSSNRQWGPHALPLPLQGLGVPGCSLLVAPDVVVPVPLSGGQGRLAIPIPSHATFVGLPFYQQAVVVDPALSPLPLTLSDGRAGVVGSR